MRQYRIRDGVGFACFEGRTIILDVAADRYWQLPAELGEALEALSTGAGDHRHGPALARLAVLGFAVPAAAAEEQQWGKLGAPASDIMPPMSSICERPAPRLGRDWRAIGEVMLLAIAARVVLRTRPLQAILERIVARRERLPLSDDGPGLEAHAQQFDRLRRWLPLRPLCLPDAIAFLWFVMRRGHAPRLVFGVEAFPFTAHCWVQQGDIVLTDALDHARRFRPILVL